METKDEIIKTRIGGLGSSDAKMVMKIGKAGMVSDADKFRIAQMRGMEEMREFSTSATRKGNRIEAEVYELIRINHKGIVSNPYYKSEKLSKRFGFDVFNHIDYELETDNELIWIEHKSTKSIFSETFYDYEAQLAWHYMLLHEKAENLGKIPILKLSHYLTNDDEDEEFDISKYRIDTVSGFANFDLIMKGLELISKAIENFEYEKMEELPAEMLPEKLQQQILDASLALKTIADASKKVDEFKGLMHDLMKENCVKSIKNDYFTITYVGESVSTQLDLKRLKHEKPDIYKDYERKVEKKSYVKLTLNVK